MPYQNSFKKRCPQCVIHMNYLDAHLYIFSKAVVTHLVENPYINSLKGELLPSLVRKQFRNYAKLVNQIEEQRKKVDQGDEHETDPNPARPLIKGILDRDELSHLLTKLEPTASKKHFYHRYIYPSSVIKCFAYVMNEQEDGPCLRANNLNSYMEANKNAVSMIQPLLRLSNPSNPIDIEFDENGQPKYNIGSDCMFGKNVFLGTKVTISDGSFVGSRTRIEDGSRVMNSIVMDDVVVGSGVNINNSSIVGSSVTLGAKVNLKRSHVGSQSRIKEESRITNSVIMENVTIESGAQISNSIIGRGASIGGQAKLTNCIVACGQTVRPESKSIPRWLISIYTCINHFLFFRFLGK